MDLIFPTSLSCPPQPHPMFRAQGIARLSSKVTFLHVSPCGRGQGAPGPLWGPETGLQRRQQRRPRLPLNSSSRFASFLWALGLRGNLGRREEPLGRPQLRVPPGMGKLGARYCWGSVPQPPRAWRPHLPRSPGMRCSSPTCSDAPPPGDVRPHLRCSAHLQCFLAPMVLPPP